MYIGAVNPYILLNVKTLGTGVQRANSTRNYCIYNDMRVNALAKNPEISLPLLKEELKKPQEEDKTLETLAVLDKIADNSPELVKPLYPELSRFNDTNSPDVQVMLSGIYRKILVPDAFGPLLKMLHKQITNPSSKYFDPTEETGGAVLEYIRACGAIKAYNTAP